MLLDEVKIVSGVPSKGTVQTQTFSTIANIVLAFCSEFCFRFVLDYETPSRDVTDVSALSQGAIISELIQGYFIVV